MDHKVQTGLSGYTIERTGTVYERVGPSTGLVFGHIPLQTARTHRFFYRLTARRLGGRLPGYHILWLTAVGRKTGRPRTWPLIYFPAGDTLVVLASNNGADTHPQWYFNLLRTPQATIEVDGRARPVCARTATAEERARLWPV